MASLRSSAGVGLAGSANPGACAKKPRPDLPSPAVSRSSVFPSYALVAIVPLAKDGRVFRSLLDRHAASERTSSGRTFLTETSGRSLDRTEAAVRRAM